MVNNIFPKLGFASLLYALLFTFCLFDNLSGITVILWIVGTIAYVYCVMKMLDRDMKKNSILLICPMVLLGISTFTTGNGVIIFLNYVAFFLLLIWLLVHNFYHKWEWGFGKSFLVLGHAVFGAIECLPLPFKEAREYIRTKKKNNSNTSHYVFLGVLIAIPCVLFLGVLLVSADAVFANVIQEMFGFISKKNQSISTCIMFIFGFLSSYCGMRFFLKEQKLKLMDEPVNKKETMIAITFTLVIGSMYLVFSMIQIVYLFLGYGTLPEGMTYANYARTGFFQLLFVCIANIFLVLTVKSHFMINRILKLNLLAICGCTFIMIASSFYRMLLYIGAYHLTFLRVFVLVTLTAICFMMIGVVIHLFRDRFPLFRYTISFATVIYLIFSFAHVDLFIAKYNLDHITEDTKIETFYYLSDLSSDAAPAIEQYVKENLSDKEIDIRKKEILEGDMYEWNVEEGEIDWYLYYVKKIMDREENMTLRSFNLSRYIANKVLG